MRVNSGELPYSSWQIDAGGLLHHRTHYLNRRNNAIYDVCTSAQLCFRAAGAWWLGLTVDTRWLARYIMLLWATFCLLPTGLGNGLAIS